MKTRFALLLTLGVLMGACGSPSGGTQGDALQIISAAATKTAAAGTSSVEMTMDMEVMGTSIQMVGTGENDLDAQQSHMTMESTAGDLPGMGEFEVVTDGAKVYMKTPDGFPGIAAGDKPWTMLDATDMGGGAFGFGQPSGDASQFLDYLKGVSGDIETLGTEEVRGVNTTHYKAMMDFEKVLDEAASQKEEMEATLDQLKSQLGTTEMPIEIWIGDDGLLRRMTISFSTDGEAGDPSMKMSMSIEMFDFGKPVQIEIPPASEVSKATDLMGSTPSP
jgi:hypothetical protein